MGLLLGLTQRHTKLFRQRRMRWQRARAGHLHLRGSLTIPAHGLAGDPGGGRGERAGDRGGGGRADFGRGCCDRGGGGRCDFGRGGGTLGGSGRRGGGGPLREAGPQANCTYAMYPPGYMAEAAANPAKR